MKIAMSSDNHLDVNRVDIELICNQQAEFLNNNDISYYLYAGDLFNNFSRTLSYFEKLSTKTNARIKFIAGNHDMLNGITFDELQNPNISSMYLHNKFIDIQHTDWRIIGNNGWYDYSFSKLNNDPLKIQQWKNAFWIDNTIIKPFNDFEYVDLVIKQLKLQLDASIFANKKVILMTHFAPQSQTLWKKPNDLSPKFDTVFEMVNAFLGSQRTGDLIQEYKNVYYTLYGHVHGIHPPLILSNNTYINQAVGVKKRKRNEWQQEDFLAQWIYKLKIIDVN